jgi:WD40 repeat protein
MVRDAVVVGINAYQALPSLKAPARDAEAIAQVLQTNGEFRVHRMPEVIQAGQPSIGHKTQVTLRDLETALINLFKPKGGHSPETALFYFSGHGLQREAGVREGYLALSDSQPDKGFYGLSLFWLRRLLQESPVRQRIIMLDCCHSGELLNFLEADSGAQPGTDRLFMAASRAYEPAFESLDSPYSIFTQAVLAGLDPQRVAAGIVTNHSLTDYVNHTLKGEIQQPLFECSGSEIVLTRQIGAPALLPNPVQATDACPYRGLEAFDEEHAEYFFGRDELTATLITQLKTDRFVAVVGASGIGKSSLVRAGMISRLRQEKTALGDDRWRIKLLSPARHPLRSLAAAFIDPTLPDLERAEQLRRAEEFLQDGGNGLAQLVRASLPVPTIFSKRTQADQPRLLLVIDQFEEVFTLSQGSEAEQERQQFFDCLLNAAELVKDRLSIVIVLRTDFLPKCSLYEGLASQISRHQLRVTPLKYEQIKATIVQPAQKVGIVCASNLIYTMLLDSSGAPGELPLLQYTLLELWQRRQTGADGATVLTLESYQELGGIQGTLQKRATDVFCRLTEPEQPIAQRIFLALTQLGDGTEDTRRRVSKSELVTPAYSMEAVNQVLEKLVTAKLIVVDHEIDVIHEALIRNWPLLRTWLNDHREILRRLRKVEQSAQEWDQSGQSIAGDYLLSGLRLEDAEDLRKRYPQELSTLAQQFIAVSCEDVRRARRESRQLQIAVPSVLLAALAVMFSQYYGSVTSQAEKVQQLQRATSRERAAIAQSILQTNQADPMSALLVSRLAAEQGSTVEAQSSLRAALQALRLQLELPGHTGAIHHLAFSPNQRHLATASADGTVRLWSINPQTIYNSNLEPSRVLLWSTSGHEPANSHDHPDGGVEPCQHSDCALMNGAAADVLSVSFSPDSRLIAAIARESSTVNVWSVESPVETAEANSARLQLSGSAAVMQVVFSPDGQWIATAHRDRSIAIWQVATGQLVTRLPHAHAVDTHTPIQFTPDGRYLLSVASERTVQLWRFHPSTGNVTVEKAIALSHPVAAHQAVFSRTGRWVVTAGADGKTRFWQVTTGQLVKTLAAPRSGAAAALGPVTQLRLSPSEYTLAIADANDRLQLWDVNTGQLRHTLSTASATEPSTASATDDQSPYLLSFNPTGTLLASASSHDAKPHEDHSAYLWNTETGERVGYLPGHTKPIQSMQFSPDGTYIATASADGMVRLWAAESGGELPTLALPNAAIDWATFVQTGAVPAQSVAAQPTTAQPLFSVPTAILPPARQATAQSSAIGDAILSDHPIGQFSPPPDKVVKAEQAIANLVTVTASGRLQRWQILAEPLAAQSASTIHAGLHATVTASSQNFGQQVLSLLIHPFRAFAPISTQILRSTAASRDGKAASRSAVEPTAAPDTASVTASIQSLAAVQLDTDSNQSLRSITLSPDGRLLAAATSQGWIEISQIQTNQSTALLHRMPVRQEFAETPANLGTSRPIQAPNAQLATVDAASQQASSGTGAIGASPTVIRNLSFSADNQLLLGIADDFAIWLWDVQSGRLLHRLSGHQASVQRAEFSPDGQWIASASWDKTVKIWRVTSGELLRSIPHPDAVNSVNVSSDSQQLVTAGWDGIARVFDLATGEQLLSLNEHQHAILDASFSPDGTLLATANSIGTAHLWDARSGTLQAELNPNRSSLEPVPISRVFFSPDGQYLSTLTKDGKVHLWAATWDMLLKLARDRSLRQLSQEECDRYLQLAPEECPALPLNNAKVGGRTE